VPSGKVLEKWGAEAHTTNNRMELRAVIEGLKTLKRRARVHVVTDSAYVKNGITQWVRGWKLRGWKRKTATGLAPVKNVELWQELDRLMSLHVLSFEHVRGHSGHVENERCDELAVAAYQGLGL
jgi:ribonuclease HI